MISAFGELLRILVDLEDVSLRRQALDLEQQHVHALALLRVFPFRDLLLAPILHCR